MILTDRALSWASISVGALACTMIGVNSQCVSRIDDTLTMMMRDNAQAIAENRAVILANQSALHDTRTALLHVYEQRDTNTHLLNQIAARLDRVLQ